MNIVDKMVEYYNKREAEILGYLPVNETENLIIIVTEILSWLKLERKREIWAEQGKSIKNQPMELNMNYPWSKDLLKILESDNSLADVFCIKNDHLCFKDDISDEYIHEARRLAYEKYNPQIIMG